MKNLFSNYILNDGNVDITGNLNISGIYSSNTTNLLSISSNTIYNKLETYNLNQLNLYNGLSVSSSNVNNKLELYETLNINNFSLLGISGLQLDINQNNSNLLQGIQNSLLQNQI